MRDWATVVLVGVGVMVVSWTGLIVLARFLPDGAAKELARFLPACATTMRRLRSHPAVPIRAKFVLGFAGLWVLSPIDLIPEFIPVIGPLDDVLVVALALRYAARSVPREVVLGAWPGDPRLIERLLGQPRAESGRAHHLREAVGSPARRVHDDHGASRHRGEHAPHKESRMSQAVDIGIPSEQLDRIVHGLSRVLADSYTLYLKSHNYHWNVVGPMFHSLHTMFEVEYGELALAVDEIAERIRALGAPAPATYRQFTELSVIAEDTDRPDAPEMIRRLVAAHEATARTIREILPLVEEAPDQVSTDLLVRRLDVHEKTAWMLRSMLA